MFEVIFFTISSVQRRYNKGAQWINIHKEKMIARGEDEIRTLLRKIRYISLSLISVSLLAHCKKTVLSEVQDPLKQTMTAPCEDTTFSFEKNRLPASKQTSFKCPTSDEDVGEVLYENYLKMENKNEFFHLVNKMEQCAYMTGTTKGKQCLSRLSEIQLGVKMPDADEKPTGNFQIAPVFSSNKFITNFLDGSQSKSKMGLVMEKLHAELPPGSKTLQFDSAVTGHTTFVTIYKPKPDEEVHLHYHAKNASKKKDEKPSIRYLSMKIRRNRDQLPDIKFALISGGDPNFNTRFAKHFNQKVSGCVKCHRRSSPVIYAKKVGMRAFGTSMAPEKLLQEIGDSRVLLSSAKGFPTYDGLPPAIGPIESSIRTEAFIDECTAVSPNLSTSQKSIIRSSMNCVGCHKSSGLGDIHLRPTWFSGSPDEKIFDRSIHSGFMPRKSISLNYGNHRPGIFLNYMKNLCSKSEKPRLVPLKVTPSHQTTQ